MNFPTLYAKSSTGKIKEWYIQVVDNKIITAHGYSDGKKQTDEESVEGKSIGRSNETSPAQQAIIEAQSKWNKKIDKGYKENINDDDIALLPMLALDYNKRKANIYFPCFVQPKLDGVRNLCYKKNDKIIYGSRDGKDYGDVVRSYFDDELDILMEHIRYPDGELYTPDLNFQEIISAVKKESPLTSELKYYIYDQVSDNDFCSRYFQLRDIFDLYNFKKLILVPSITVQNETEMLLYHEKFVSEGYEGAIIRNFYGPYKTNHRSPNLQKYKSFMDDEYIITNGFEATGRDIGTVIFQCSTPDGKLFNVRPKGTRLQRKEWLSNINTLIGKKLTVKFQNLSNDGIPRFPVGINIREGY